MVELLNRIMPNVMSKLPDFYEAIMDTLVMTFWSGAIAFVLGLILGIVLIVTKKGGILQNVSLYAVLDKLINFFRSIPFIILLSGVMPLSRYIMGTAIGVNGAIVPLIFGTVPFFARQIERGVMPLSRYIMGTAIGVNGAIVPLIFGTVPFFARQIESAMSEIDYGLTEAALSMGLSPLQIIWRVYLKESIAGIARATTITTISLIGLTAMAGVVQCRR